AYKQYFDPDPPPPPPPDMTGYIELKPVEDAGDKDPSRIYYIAGERNVLGWDELSIPVYYTYDGSPDDERQAITFEVEHGAKVKVLERVTKHGTSWCRIETVEEFKRRGWVTANYITSKKPPTPEEIKDWAEAKEEAEQRKQKEAEAEAARRRQIEQARRGG
ncbi:MAG TPA: hypothetical protein VEI97_07575, partial [bacterium]|nr:hypothetical protein [bacterium]